jgi:hypothetical protein
MHPDRNLDVHVLLTNLVVRLFQAAGGADGGVLLAGKDVVDVAAKLNVVVGELAELGVIKTNVLVLGRSPERQPRDEVHQEQDDTGHDERVRETGDAVGQLVTELDPVVVQPASGDRGGTVKVGNVVTVRGGNC